MKSFNFMVIWRVMGVVALFGMVAPACGQGVAPFAQTQAAGPITSSNATLNGMVVPNGFPTTAWFEWGTKDSLGHTTAPMEVGDGTAVVRVSKTVEGLEWFPNYQFRLVASNQLGVVRGAIRPLSLGRCVAAWGDNYSGQLDVPAFFTNVVKVAGGGAFSLALNTDGTVVGWGVTYGSNVPPGLANVAQIAAGTSHAVALKADGTLTAWGFHSSGQTNIPAGATNIIAVACGTDNNLALKADGTLLAWGSNEYGKGTVPAGLSNIVETACGNYHSLALRADGTVTTWGGNFSGQRNVPAGLSNVVAIASGWAHSLALKADGTVVAWGSITTVPTGASNVIAISSGPGSAHCVALRSDGSVLAWGNIYAFAGATAVPAYLVNAASLSGGINHCLAAYRPTPEAFTQDAWIFGGERARLNGMARAGGQESVAWFEVGERGVFTQSTSPTGVGSGLDVAGVAKEISGLTPARAYQYRLVLSNASGVVTGSTRLFSTGHKVAAWGDNTHGQTDLPSGLSNVVAVAAGFYQSLTLRADGTVSAWGSYSNGTSYVPASTPADLSNVVAVAASLNHCLALRSNGTVVAWGRNNYGQTNVPADLTNAIAIAASLERSYVLRDDGTVLAWGNNPGNATNIPASWRNIVALGSGPSYYVLALRIDGKVEAWPSSGGGSTVPADLGNCVSVAAGGHSLATRTDGRLVAWGGTYMGQAGFIASASNVLGIACGMYHDLAVQAEGTVLSAGGGAYERGQSAIPLGLTNALGVAGGVYHSLALAPNVLPQASSLTVTGALNQDWLVPLSAFDVNGDPLTFRIATLPSSGNLYQYTDAGRGPAILSPDTLVTDPLARVIFTPEANAIGWPYTTFTFVVSDGEADSASATVTVNLIPLPVIEVSSLTVETNRAFSLRFNGDTNAGYRVWASTNLTTWSALGAATRSPPGVFNFTDTAATNWPQRFYRVTCP